MGLKSSGVIARGLMEEDVGKNFLGFFFLKDGEFLFERIANCNFSCV